MILDIINIDTITWPHIYLKVTIVLWFGLNNILNVYQILQLCTEVVQGQQSLMFYSTIITVHA